MEPVVDIRDLRVDFTTDAGEVSAVDGVSLHVNPGEVLAIVGESGSGKSVSAKTILRLLPENATVSGAVVLAGQDVVNLSASEMRAVRGRDVAMVFQEPSTALNPVFTVGWQIAEGLRAHGKVSKKEARARAIEVLGKVGIPDPAERVDHYPHQFSGGQKQRVVIAMALALEPKVIVADEPTTALDVTVQAEILDLLRRVRDEFGRAIVLITHNMGVVADLADRVAVMNDGKVVEQADVHTIFSAPQHEYTRLLLGAVPVLGTQVRERAGVLDLDTEPVVRARDLEIVYPGRLGRPGFRAVDGVSFDIRPGEVLGLVGESGSGKTTIGRAIAGLTHASGGSLSVLGHEMVGHKEREFRPLRQRIGFVFQDPATSFNPKMTIAEGLAEPLVIHGKAKDWRAARPRVMELLDAVHLPQEFAKRFPHELSGGQRQRASLARALALDPDLLVADEPTSALDVSVQAKVLEVFLELQERLGFATLFISHDLAVVGMLADRVGVLYRGKLVEEGPSARVLASPEHPYTQRLLTSVPVPDPVEQASRREALARLRG
ncbi:ABC transporter ATP-binding protein [Flavimobilis marinus]|uniref:Peptide/nickel transport system ATP-binding protein n=1 Tax=Flavimobilis marinus TaxID=285351 RepID=A0A1I2G6N7_9MICO|nr:ABC transporter ATP-binding protein [Flavimobilis marinus]GHG50092.1 ABC transporter ATP-binding protein [Flavimobilis marinus]SFF12640.1 peptide/nickel transport system ATP-binding protein [Flavimobilis marinus]